jgi:hypothetical protein
VIEYDDLIDAPRRGAQFQLARAEAFVLTELYLDAQLKLLAKAPQSQVVAAEMRGKRRLDDLIATGLIAPEEVDHMAERLLAAHSVYGGGRLAGLGPDASQRSGPGGLRFVRRRLRREGVPGADWRCLYTVYADAWSRGMIDVGTLPNNEEAYQTIKELMSERPFDGPPDALMESDLPF